MKRFKKTFALLLTAALLFCAAGSALAAASPTPTPAPKAGATMPPATVAGKVEGTVMALDANDVIINMDNGNTLSFALNYIANTDAKVGDKVTVEYAGSLADTPEAVAITVTQAAMEAPFITGVVMQHDDTSVFVQIDTQNVYGFTINKDTEITGVEKKLKNGDEVKVTYSGDLLQIPDALTVEITKAVEKEVTNTENKSLTGVVTKYPGSTVTVKTSSGHSYKFKIDSATQILGTYALEVGSRVRVVYDGYAAKSPAAKTIKVLTPPDPTPPSTHTASGIVEAYEGVFLTLTNGGAFNTTYASFSGTGDGEMGDKAKVTYYVGDDGVNYATKVVFTTVDFDPVPEPEPDPDIFEEAE